MSTEYKEYRVEWDIEVSARTPEEAANLARRIQLDPTNTANHFYVTEIDSEGNDSKADGINADLDPAREEWDDLGLEEEES